MKAEETKITGEILKVKEQKDRRYRKIAVLERGTSLPGWEARMGPGCQWT